MKPNTFKHRMNTDQDGRFFNLKDTVNPAMQRAAAIADLIETACEVVDISSFGNDTLWRAAQAIRLEILDAQALIDAYAADERVAQMAATEEQFVTTTDWANYSLEVCGNRYRYIEKATQACLHQFEATSDTEAEEICMDFLRTRKGSSDNKKPD